MNSICLLPNPKKDVGFALSEKVADVLLSLGFRVYIHCSCGSDLSGKAVPCEEIPADCGLLIVVGGDGSVLDAAKYALAADIPLIGVNLGKLGYLSEIEPSEIDILKRLQTGAFAVEEKMLLSTEKVSGDGHSERAERLAVNDVVISHGSYLGISDFSLESSGGCVRYRADGMIFATPQGSTAYSLSAGGPIVSHRLNAVLATPVCPHSFNNRSILFSEEEKLSVKNNGDQPLHVSVDGRHFSDLFPGERVNIASSEKKLKFLTFKDSNLFSVLYRKMDRMQEK